jgi:hypothetical protein
MPNARTTGGTRITRRHLQIALGLLWLLAGALQTQRFMFTSGFAQQVMAPVGQGEPGFVSGPIHWAATVIGAHPVLANVPFAAIQLLLGAGLLVRRTAPFALAASIAWALGVWYFAEGLGGIADAQASLITGAPGAALLYAVLAVAAWPRPDAERDVPAPWLRFAWAAVWVGGAIYQLLPGQNSGRAVGTAVTTGTAGAPGWLVRLTDSAGTWAVHHGLLVVIGLALVELLIGVGVVARSTRTFAATVGIALALDFWLLGQHLGGIYSGQATDPNVGPVLVLMGVAIAAGRSRPTASSTERVRASEPAFATP